MQRTERLLAALCAIPGIVVALVYVDAVVVRLMLGRWPVASVDDPSSLPTAPLDILIALLIVSIYPSLPIIFLIAAKSWRALRSPSRYWFWFALLVFGHLLFVFSARVDPGGVWSWWWD